VDRLHHGDVLARLHSWSSLGAIGVASGLAAANLLYFLPGFVYATKGTAFRLTDCVKAMLPGFGLTILAFGAARHTRESRLGTGYPLLPKSTRNWAINIEVGRLG
jgi:hypothetical protein